MIPRFGLREGDLSEIVHIVSEEPAVREAWIFGSRAKGTHRIGSDVDIALVGEAILPQTVTRIRSMLNEETRMPYHFDVVAMNAVDSAGLREHIHRIGICMYRRGEAA